MKTALTPEESASLIELGVDASKASMVLWKQTEDWQRKSVLGNKEHLALKPFRPAVMGFESFDCKDIFTLTDLLSILPKKITDRSRIYELQMLVDHYSDAWCIEYCHNSGCNHLGDSFQSAEELIDAIHAMLVWLKQTPDLVWL